MHGTTQAATRPRSRHADRAAHAMAAPRRIFMNSSRFRDTFMGVIGLMTWRTNMSSRTCMPLMGALTMMGALAAAWGQETAPTTAPADAVDERAIAALVAQTGDDTYAVRE